MKSNLNLLGNRLRNLREDADLTQKELAIKIGLTPKMISFYENDQRTPPADILIKLADIFNITVDYLLGRTSTLNKSLLFGDRLLYLLSAKDLTKEEFCNTLGITNNTFEKWINNTSKSYSSYKTKIEKILDIPFALLADEDIPYNISEMSIQDISLLCYFHEFQINSDKANLKWGPITKFFTNAHFVSDEEKELLYYYNQLSIRDRHWIIGQIIDLDKKAIQREDSNLSPKQA